MATTIVTRGHYFNKGRLRIRVEGVSKNRGYAQFLAEWLSRKNGIQSVTANHLTGKVLIFFSLKCIGESEILQEINLCHIKYIELLSRHEKKSSIRAASGTVANQEDTAKRSEITVRLSPTLLASAKLFLWSIGFAALNFFLTRDVKRSMAVLIAGCPVAMTISRSAALKLAAAIGRGRGMFVKNENLLETISKADTVVFNVAKSIVGPTARIHEFVTIDNRYTDSEILRLAVALIGMLQPITVISADNVKRFGRDLPSFSDVEISDYGIKAVAGNEQVCVGNAKFLAGNNIPFAKFYPRMRRMEHLGLSALSIAINGKLAGILGYNCKPRLESQQAVVELQSLGMNYFDLVSCDASKSVQKIMNRLRVTKPWTVGLPECKAIIDQLQQSGRQVIMVGEGISDAQALKAATVGVVMNCSMIEERAQAADVIIKGSNLQGIPNLIRLDRFTDEVTRQNLVLSAGLCAGGIALAAARKISITASLYMLGISIMLVLFNSARIYTCEE